MNKYAVAGYYETVIVVSFPVKLAAVTVPEAVTTVTSDPAEGSVPALQLNVAVSLDTVKYASGRVPAEPKGATVVVVSDPSVTDTVPAGV